MGSSYAYNMPTNGATTDPNVPGALSYELA